jgi:hypothetical protein
VGASPVQAGFVDGGKIPFRQSHAGLLAEIDELL